jgi:hypothetical protein
MKKTAAAIPNRQHMMSVIMRSIIILTGLDLHHLHHMIFLKSILIEVESLQIEGRIYDLKPGDIVLMNTSELQQSVIHDLDKLTSGCIWLTEIFSRNCRRSRVTWPCASKVPSIATNRTMLQQQHFRGLLNQCST